MNIETRAKLGEKYIDMDLYQKPWWFRFKGIETNAQLF